MSEEIERRWLVIPDAIAWPVKFKATTLNQIGLLHPEEAEGVTERVRARLGDARTTYTHTVKRPTGKRIRRLEEEREITEAEYGDLLATRMHPEHRTISKTRYVFTWEGRTWELDRILSPERLMILECELPSEDTEVTPPPFIPIIREITEEPGWSNSEIGHTGWVHPDRLIPGVALDRLVWRALHGAEAELPARLPRYSTVLYDAEALLEEQFRTGEAINFRRLLDGKWLARSSPFFWNEDPAKRFYDEEASRLSAMGLTIPHAAAVLVVMNTTGIGLEEHEWLDRWAWDPTRSPLDAV